MKALIQRVTHASVSVGGVPISAINHGALILLGVAVDDTPAQADALVDKWLKYRFFEDEGGKTNRHIQEVGGAILLVSQFTLCADTQKGLRPSFSNAAPAAHAQALYEHALARSAAIVPTEGGVFGAMMQVALVNDGPFTLMLES